MIDDQIPPTATAFSGGLSEILCDDTLVELPCDQCGALGEVARGAVKAFGVNGLCPDCDAKDLEERRIKSLREWWRLHCPYEYHDTSTEHKEWNAEAWQALKQRAPDLSENVMLVGSTGSCKSRAMVLRMKLALNKGKSIGWIWSDELDAAIDTRKTSALLDSVAEISVLGVDNIFSASGSYENYQKFLTNLVDRRLRRKQTTIITTRLKGRDVTEVSQSWNNTTRADNERIQSLLRRFRGSFVTVDFDNPNQGGGSGW